MNKKTSHPEVSRRAPEKGAVTFTDVRARKEEGIDSLWT